MTAPPLEKPIQKPVQKPAPVQKEAGEKKEPRKVVKRLRETVTAPSVGKRVEKRRLANESTKKTIQERLGTLPLHRRLGLKEGEDQLKFRLGKSAAESVNDRLGPKKVSPKEITNRSAKERVIASRLRPRKKPLSKETLDKQLDRFMYKDAKTAAVKLDMDLDDYMKDMSDMEL